MSEDLSHALAAVAEQGDRLNTQWRFEWAPQLQQAVHRLRIPPERLDGLTLCAVVGGASSGKSTVFDNLLGGRLASRVTARGHATLGPILALHESKRERVAPLFEESLLLPGLAPRQANLDDNVVGDPEALTVIYHDVDDLVDVLLFDTPDITSEAARREGDVALALLPWFDRLIVVIDHERWFDRQTVSQLKQHSARFGHQRIALFNRTQEGELAEADRRLLERQAERLGADDAVILEFRRGRGFCHFPPGTLDDVGSFLRRKRSLRTASLWAFVADGANRVLSQNEERAARLTQLEEALEKAVARSAPTPWDCLSALMNAAEREQMDIVSRVLRIRQTRQWLANQRRRVESVLRRVPLVGVVASPLVGGVRSVRGGGQTLRETDEEESDDRHVLAWSYFEKTARRQGHDLQRAARTSRFWDEIRRWTGIEPPDVALPLVGDDLPGDDLAGDEVVAGDGRRPQGATLRSAVRAQVNDAASSLDVALKRWTRKVEQECQGVTWSVAGKAGAGAIGLAIVLVALPGGGLAPIWAPLAALGGGAAVGKQAGRLAAVVREKLVGSAEYDAVKQAATHFATMIEDYGRRTAQTHVDQARQSVLGKDHPLLGALEQIRDASEAIA